VPADAGDLSNPEVVKIANEFDKEGKWGDRRQELVFIGVDMVEEEITALFDACLLNDHEMLQFEELMVSSAPPSSHPSPSFILPLVVPVSWSWYLGLPTCHFLLHRQPPLPLPMRLPLSFLFLSLLLPTRFRRSLTRLTTEG